MTWTLFLGLASETGPNGATAAFGCDSLARPSSATSPHGAVTWRSYTSSPPTITETVNGRWKKTTLDGLGRTVKVETGNGTTTLSIQETEYGLCACTPMGKVKRVSEPYAPGGTPVWTTHSYDARGRVTSVVAPDGAATTYAYAGNTITVTDPKGRWKKTAFDVFGNIVQVNEPNPSGGADLVTTYQYNGFDKLTQVTMTRGAVTQTRTYVYDSAQRLQSKTEPETGTTTFTYL